MQCKTNVTNVHDTLPLEMMYKIQSQLGTGDVFKMESVNSYVFSRDHNVFSQRWPFWISHGLSGLPEFHAPSGVFGWIATIIW